MKKLLSLLGAVSIVASGSSAIAISSTNMINSNRNLLQSEDSNIQNALSAFNVSEFFLKQEEQKSEPDLNWDDIKEYTKDYIESISKEINFENSINFSSSTFSNDEIMDIASNKAFEYLNFLSENNFNYEDSIIFLNNTSPEFKANYEQELEKFNSLIDQQSEYDTNSFNKSKFSSVILNPWEQYEYYLSTRDVLLDLRSKLRLFCIGASAAAAGYWATCFWTFGATAPKAILCTAIAAALGITIAIVNHGLNQASNAISLVKTIGIAAIKSISLILALKKLLLIPLNVLLGSLTATSWAFYGSLACISVVAGIIFWLSELYDI